MHLLVDVVDRDGELLAPVVDGHGVTDQVSQLLGADLLKDGNLALGELVGEFGVKVDIIFF